MTILPEELHTALMRFDEAAKAWGWEADMGTGDSSMSEAMDEYDASKADLIEAISMALTQGVAA